RKAKAYRLGWDKSGFAFKTEDQQFFLNLVEMFFCLVLQTLQPKSLLRWLPKDVRIRDDLRGLNLDVPVTEIRHRAITTIWDSTDPEVLAYARSVVTRNLGAAQAVLQAVQYKPLTDVRRAMGVNFTSGVYRSADAGAGDPTSVEVKCTKCGWTRTDQTPSFVCVTGEYLNRTIGCEKCPLQSSDVKMGRKTASKTFEPVSNQVRSVTKQAVRKRMAKSTAWRDYYEGKGPEPAKGKPTGRPKK
ncbi:hypothetical protein C8A01DRAFT_18544, partial [Parachaetomium inaequale]